METMHKGLVVVNIPDFTTAMQIINLAVKLGFLINNTDIDYQTLGRNASGAGLVFHHKDSGSDSGMAGKIDHTNLTHWPKANYIVMQSNNAFLYSGLFEWATSDFAEEIVMESGKTVFINRTVETVNLDGDYTIAQVKELAKLLS